VTAIFANSIHFRRALWLDDQCGLVRSLRGEVLSGGRLPLVQTVWQPEFRDNPGDEAGYSIAVDSAGNVLVGGSFGWHCEFWGEEA